MTTRTERAPALPTGDDVGRVDDWILPLDDAPTGVTEFRGRFLAFVSSRRLRHADHEGPFARAGERCSACRWFEPRIFRVDAEDGGGYVVHYVGGTIVPDEVMRCRADRVLTAFEVVEALTTRRGAQEPFLTIPAAKVLAQGATYDDDLNEAYVNRAVS